MRHVRIDLDLVLPDAHDARDVCVCRLVDLLENHPGIQQAHVDTNAEDDVEQYALCVHYDADVMALDRVHELIRTSGADIRGRYGHAVIDVPKAAHPRRARALEKRLRKLDGVVEVSASSAGYVRVEYDRSLVDRAAIDAEVRGRGRKGKVDEARRREDHEHEDHEHDEGGDAEEHEHHHGAGAQALELVAAIAAAAALAAGVLVAHLEVGPAWLPLALYIASFALAGIFTLLEAAVSWFALRFEIDSLMLVAAGGAAALGEWAEGAFLLVLFSIGHALERFAMGRARRAIEALSELAPDEALVRRDGTESTVAVGELTVGDIVIVKPHERMPIDGAVIAGASTVNEAPITGESMPVNKSAVDDVPSAAADWESLSRTHKVFAGSINGDSALDIVVARLASESTLARVARLVSQAETHKSQTQRFTDRFERIFVPATIGTCVLLMFAWIVVDEPFSASFYRAMAVLVAASPCALAISTPSAVLSAVARAGRGGVLFKGGAPLETLGRITAVAFDKTGTLTRGEPRVVDVHVVDDVPRDELASIAAAVESRSDHPLARAIARDLQSPESVELARDVNDVRAVMGKGITAELGDERIYIGSLRMFDMPDTPSVPAAIISAVADLESRGRTAAVVVRGDRCLGALGLMDEPRAEAAAAIAALRATGIKTMVMISGDNQRVADAVGGELGIDDARGGLLPEDKVTAIRELHRTNAGVAMVGDGVNDAPAMASATVGLAMGAAGSDVALETADVALMSDDLSRLPFAIGLSRRAASVIRQNLWFSLGVVALLVPATIAGLRIGPAVVMHEGSTVLVVVNALRLLAYNGRVAQDV